MHSGVPLELAQGRSFAPLRMTTYFAPLRMTICFLLAGGLLLTLSCSQPPDPNTLVMIIESSPTNLDPRVGIDAQSERIGELLFDALLIRDEHLNVQPGLAERWEIPDPLTYVFHLHRGVTFHDGRAADFARREVDIRFAAGGKGSQHQVGGLPVRGSRRSARRWHGDISSEGA